METGSNVEVTWESTQKQETQVTPQKGPFIQNILDGVKWTPCEIFDIKKKERALGFLINPGLLQDREYSNIESWQEYFRSLSNDPIFMDLKAYYNLWYINDEEVGTAIEQFLAEKSANDLIKKYVGHIEFDLFIAITETLRSQEEREAQEQISLDDSAILFNN